MENSKTNNTEFEKIFLEQNQEQRSGEDRRKEPSSGYTCISMVGWICRREKLRRKGDPDDFGQD